MNQWKIYHRGLMDIPIYTCFFLYWNVVYSLNLIWLKPNVVVCLPLWWCSHLCSSRTGWMPSWADHLQSLSKWWTGQTQSPGPETRQTFGFGQNNVRVYIQYQIKLARAHLEANGAVLVCVEGLKKKMCVHTGICKDTQWSVVYVKHTYTYMYIRKNNK